jgi:hypothetical protein
LNSRHGFQQFSGVVRIVVGHGKSKTILMTNDLRSGKNHKKDQKSTIGVHQSSIHLESAFFPPASSHADSHETIPIRSGAMPQQRQCIRSQFPRVVRETVLDAAFHIAAQQDLSSCQTKRSDLIAASSI